MNKSENKKIHKSFVLQQGESDCGVACLLSVIRYYNGENTLENLRRHSGTNITGTSLLGLYHAALQTGFTAQGCQADLAALQAHKQPCLLHVVIEKGNLQHYVVCYGSSEQQGKLIFIIGDPARGILHLSAEELQEIWQSRTCLTLAPGEHFVQSATIKARKRAWIKTLVKEDYPVLIIAAALGVTVAALGMAMAIFSQRLVDNILPTKNFTKLNMGIALVFALLLAKEGLSMLRQHLLLRQSKGFNIRIIHFFYRHLLQLPRQFFDTRKIGELTARLNDTSRIQRVISQLAGSTMTDTLVATASISFIFSYSWQAGIICLMAMPVFFWLIYAHNKQISNGQRTIMVTYSQAEANYVSTLQGIEPIKNYNKQELYTNSNKVIYQGYQDAVFSLGTIQIRLSFIANSFGVLFLTGILTFTSYQVVNNHLKTGELIAILTMCGSLLPSVANLALLSIPISEAKIAFERMFEFTGIAAEEQPPAATTLAFESLQVQQLTFRFAGRGQLLKGISMQVNKGEIIALMGENGSGKTTFLHLLQKNYSQESGSIIINNHRLLDTLSFADWHRVIGVVPQNIHLFNGSVLENIAFEDAIKEPEKVLNFLVQYGFASFLDALPQSYMTLLGEEGINISGGQRQIIALARALYQQPQLLVLDEATSAMDRQTEQFVLQLLRKIKANMGIIFITHKLHILKSFCNKIYILEQGIVTHYGTHQQLVESENLYNAYWADLALSSQ